MSRVIRPTEVTEEMIRFCIVDDPYHFAGNLNAVLKYGYCSQCKLCPSGCMREGCRGCEGDPVPETEEIWEEWKGGINPIWRDEGRDVDVKLRRGSILRGEDPSKLGWGWLVGKLSGGDIVAYRRVPKREKQDEQEGKQEQEETKEEGKGRRKKV